MISSSVSRSRSKSVDVPYARMTKSCLPRKTPVQPSLMPSSPFHSNTVRKPVGVRPQGDGKLLVDVDEALAVVGYLSSPSTREACRARRDGERIPGWIRSRYSSGGFSSTIETLTPRLHNPPVGGRGDREADQVVRVGLSIVRRRRIRRKHHTGEKPGDKRRRPERSA